MLVEVYEDFGDLISWVEQVLVDSVLFILVEGLKNIENFMYEC